VGRGAQPIHLILAETEDATAAWLAAGLVERGLRTASVTPSQLCGATTLEHRLIGAGATFRITLDDDRVLDSRAIASVVNRMVRVPLSVLAHSEPADRSYVEAEWRALLCSLLNAIPGRIIDPPHPHSLAGRWRSPPEWLILAHEAGLPTPRWQWTDADDAPTLDLERDADPVRVLVVGGEALSLSPVPDEVVAACQRLAELAGVSVLEVRLVENGRLTFGFADQLPDVREGGDAALAMYARMLSA